MIPNYFRLNRMVIIIYSLCNKKLFQYLNVKPSSKILTFIDIQLIHINSSILVSIAGEVNIGKKSYMEILCNDIKTRSYTYYYGEYKNHLPHGQWTSWDKDNTDKYILFDETGKITHFS